MARAYDLDAAVEAHRAASEAGGSWTRISDMEYDAIAGSALRTSNRGEAVEPLLIAGNKLADRLNSAGAETDEWDKARYALRTGRA